AAAQVAGTAPVALELRVTPGASGAQCTGVRLDVVAGYGTALPAAAQGLRTVLARTLDDVLGSAGRTIDVCVVDVEAQDPGR
ncbi:MAG: hypothetical protein M3Y71_19535, partial [Actinomycetota bacterium]|nr:hypothetical protein [Actinomycetota bacterium]